MKHWRKQWGSDSDGGRVAGGSLLFQSHSHLQRFFFSRLTHKMGFSARPIERFKFGLLFCWIYPFHLPIFSNTKHRCRIEVRSLDSSMFGPGDNITFYFNDWGNISFYSSGQTSVSGRCEGGWECCGMVPECAGCKVCNQSIFAEMKRNTWTPGSHHWVIHKGK